MFDSHLHLLNHANVSKEVMVKRFEIDLGHYSGLLWEALDHDMILDGIEWIYSKFSNKTIDIQPILNNYVASTIRAADLICKALKSSEFTGGALLGLDLYSMDKTHRIDIVKQNLKFCKEYAKEKHNIDLKILCGFDPDRGEIEKNLEEIYRDFDGVKLYPKIWKWDPKNLKSLYNIIARKMEDKPIVLHCSGGGLGENKANIDPSLWVDALSDNPLARVVFAHCGGWGSERWEKLKILMSEFPSVFCDLAFHDAAYHHTKSYFNWLRDQLGNIWAADRILYGSDFPLPEIYRTHKQVFEIFKENLTKWEWNLISEENPKTVWG